MGLKSWWQRRKRVQLTEHFYLDEFRCKCGCGIEKEKESELRELCERALEIYRDACGGRAFTIISGIRCAWYNKNKKSGPGARNSRHLDRNADGADIRVEGLDPEVVYWIGEGLMHCGKIPWGGLHFYGGKSRFVHVDMRGEEKRW